MRKINTDEEAFISLQQGNEEGLDFLFNCYYSPLVFYANSITAHKEIAKEIAAEAFVKLWAKRETIEEFRKVKFLLYKIVNNASIDFIREKERSRKYAANLYIISNTSERSSLDALIEAETYNHLYLLLQNLPPRARQIFKLFYFQKKSIKEIALELGISVNTVKTQKQRAIQLLKKNRASLSFFFCIVFICVVNTLK
jgi:RNA polymerase sigma-70 factor (family 1)